MAGIGEGPRAASGLLPTLLASSVLGSWLFGRLWALWAIGVIGAIFLLLKGRGDERLLLIGLTLLALVAGGEQTGIGLRGVLFISTFVALARYVKLNLWVHLGLQSFGLAFAAYGESDAAIEVFLFGPSILLLILATEIVRSANGAPSFGRQAVAQLFNLASLAISGIGYGSRSALFLWAAVNARRLKLVYLIAFGGALLALVPVAIALQDLPIVQKLGNSVGELAKPIDEETGAVSQRGYENLLFLAYISAASPREILLGSTTAIFLDGGPLGQEDDVHFIPHNQIFGIMFQYGLVGSFLLLFYLTGLVKYFNADPFCSFVMVLLLLAGFILKAGFYDGNLALMAATLNWIRSQHLRRQSAIQR